MINIFLSHRRGLRRKKMREFQYRVDHPTNVAQYVHRMGRLTAFFPLPYFNLKLIHNFKQLDSEQQEKEKRETLSNYNN